MTDIARAAQTWDRIERALLRRGLIRDGRDLREQRAAMVRVVGDGPELRPDLPPPKRAPKPSRGKDRAVSHAVMLDGGHAAPVGPSSRSDSDVSKLLDRLLERSCSRRVGYDGDDSVSYD